MVSGVYIVEVLLILILGILFHFQTTLRKTNKNNLLLSGLFIALLVLVLRGNSVGVDTKNYNNYFAIIDMLSWKEAITSVFVRQAYSTEIGYTILQKLIGVFTNNAQWVIVASGLMYIYCMYYFIKNTCQDKLMAIFTFLCTGSYLLAFNAMRQSISVGICAVAWVKLQKDKKLEAFLLICLAMTFHISSIVMFLMFFTKKMPANKKSYSIIAIAVTTFALFGESLLSYVLRFFPVYAARYGKGRWNTGSVNGIIILWLLILMLIIFILFTIRWENPERHPHFEILIFSALFLGTSVLGQSFDGFARMAMFFQPYLIVLFDMVKMRVDRKSQRVYLNGVIISCTLLFFRMASTSQYQYMFFWQQ